MRYSTLATENSQSILVSCTTYCRRFYVSAPKASCHSGHEVKTWVGVLTAKLSQRVSPLVIQEIHDLVEQGLRDARAMDAIFSMKYGSIQGRAYHPTLKDIRGHVSLALRQLQQSRVDQTEIKNQVS